MAINFQLAEWLIQPSLNSISCNGTTVRLEPKVMEVLVCLASQPGEAVSKEVILKAVWPNTFVSEDVLTRSISELRRVFEDDAREARVIQTIPKRGYRLIAAVKTVNGRTSQIALSSNPASRRLGIRIVLSSLGLSVVVLASLVAFNVVSLRDRWLTRSTRPAIHSLAVLPLQSLSSDPAQEYFAEGMTDALITDLAQISALKVVSRTTVMNYGRPNKPLSQTARELNVDGIIEGTVQRSGDRVRITAQLIYGPADQHLWANSFDRDIKDVLALQSAIASEIANQIQVKITPEEQAKFKNLRPVNPKALDAYVEAQFHMSQAGKLEYYRGKQELLKEELRRAVSYLDHATQEDPTYIPAYVAYFDAIDATNTSQLEFWERAKTGLAKALQVDEHNVAAHLAFGRFLMQFEYDWAGAEREYKRAIQLDPNSGDAHFQYSEYLENMGQTALGDKERDLAQRLDPAHDYFADAGVSRNNGQTLDQQRKALEEKAPNDPFSLAVMGKSYAIAGRFQESVEMWERCLTLYGWHDFAQILKRADAQGGPKFALEQWMRAGEDYETNGQDMPVVPMAFTYASLRNTDRAFAWLDKAAQQRNWMLIYLKRDNVWDPLRTDPRFNALLRRVGLPR